MSDKKLAPCGTYYARRRHKRRGETCDQCGPMGKVGANGRDLAPCGTKQARDRHRRNNETCKSCTDPRLSPCGTKAAKNRHYRRGETCETCNPPRTNLPAPCGTQTARKRHNRNGETCQVCEDSLTRPRISPCGTPAARKRHAAKNETCPTCEAARPKRPPLKPCGTYAAYNRHRKHGETPCDPCVDAYREYKRVEQASYNTTLKTPQLVEEITFLLNAGEGTHRILEAIGYTGREKAFRDRLYKTGHHDLANRVLKPWYLAA